MSEKKKYNIIMYVSIISFALMSVSFLLMPLDIMLNLKNSSFINIVIGILFWITLIIGVIGQIVLSFLIKKAAYIKQNKRFGIITFFSNKYAVIFDLVFIVALIGFIIAAIATKLLGYSCYVFLALVVFSFTMHCIFNGNSYKVIKNLDKLKSESKGEENNE